MSRVDSASRQHFPPPPRCSIPNAPLPRPPFSSCTPVHTQQSAPSHGSRSRTRPRPRESASRAECAAACSGRFDKYIAHHPRLSVALTHPGLYNTRSVEGVCDRRRKRGT
ncbi:hypothetical protein C8R43DRAFT_1137507 [Mycena crocata]|nr:hypothetical protein C8R43DRAFT_1137507 [Mycena crocata]